MASVSIEAPGAARQVIVCDWLPPEFGAVGQYMLQRAERLAQAGGDVILIGLTRGSEGRSETQVGAGRLRTIRISAPATPKQSLVRRALWALGVNLRLLAETRSAQRVSGPVDILVTGSPPFLSQILILANLAWKRRLTYRITDFYPETALAAGRARFLAPALPLFRWVRRRASLIEIIGEDQGRRLSASGFPAERLHLHRDSSPVAIAPGAHSAPRPFGDDAVVLLYSGNLGVAHDITTFCEAYRRHVREGSNRVRLWVNGTGVRVAELKAYCEAHDLPLHLTGPAPLEQLPGLLLAADAHLVLLGEAFWGYVLPSKIYACLESRRPILYVGPAESDIALLLESQGGHGHAQARPGDVDACYGALEVFARRGAQRARTAPAEVVTRTGTDQ